MGSLIDCTEDDTDGTRNTLELDGDISPTTDIPFKSRVLIISKHQSYLTHGIHKFPAKFFPELPRYFIKKYSKPGEHILDPMCGSGTTLLEAAINSRTATGIDIDPIALLISRVKTTPLDPRILQNIEISLAKSIDEKITDGHIPHIPEFNYRDTWFEHFVLKELGIILECIEDTTTWMPAIDLDSNQVQVISDFLKIAFSSIIRDVSNADPNCTRTVIRKNLEKNLYPRKTIEMFRDALSYQIDAIGELHNLVGEIDFSEVDLLSSDASDTGLPDESVDLAVTSPPYINAVDYVRTHQLEMYWLGMLDDKPLSNTKRQYIGTETVYQAEYKDLQISGYQELDCLLAKVFSKDPRRSFIIYKFFMDMCEQLRETHRVLKPGSRYCIVIGNNVIRGNLVPSHRILCEIAASKDVGFALENCFFSELIRHFIRIPRKERMDGEWVLILKK